MWYVIQVFSGKEESALQLIERLADSSSYDEIFAPYFTTSRKIDGEWKRVRESLTPGYLIVITDRVEKFESELKKVPALTKLLGGDTAFSPLDPQECAWLDAWTQRGNRVLERSTGRIEKGKVKILSGPLFGREADIVKVNRRKRQATIKMPFMGREKEIVLELEILGSR